MMRRLDIRPQKKLRGGARYERAFRRDMGRVAQWYPAPEAWDEMYDHWKLPIYEKAASPRHGRAEFRREVVETLVSTAEAVRGNRPGGSRPSRVAAIIDWPGLFGSEICVFFDADYARSFDPTVGNKATRQEFDGGWVQTRAPTHDLFADMGIALPDGFVGGGIAFEEYDEDFGDTHAWERWVAIETSEGTAS